MSIVYKNMLSDFLRMFSAIIAIHTLIATTLLTTFLYGVTGGSGIKFSNINNVRINYRVK